MCLSTLQEVEDIMTLDSFLEQHEYPFRQPDIHSMKIIDFHIGPHKKTMKHKFSIPNFIEEYSLGKIYTSRMHHSIRVEFDFTAGISDYRTGSTSCVWWLHRKHREIGIMISLELLLFTFCWKEVSSWSQPRKPSIVLMKARECIEKICETENAVTWEVWSCSGLLRSNWIGEC